MKALKWVGYFWMAMGVILLVMAYFPDKKLQQETNPNIKDIAVGQNISAANMYIGLGVIMVALSALGE